ncbi:hypothetical protein F01_200099 [Burkholderia cenocepacia]|nr:hypothetical protein F01_200099 [Burkholderia cenocepacia]
MQGRAIARRRENPASWSFSGNREKADDVNERTGVRCGVSASPAAALRSPFRRDGASGTGQDDAAGMAVVGVSGEGTNDCGHLDHRFDEGSGMKQADATKRFRRCQARPDEFVTAFRTR